MRAPIVIVALAVLLAALAVAAPLSSAATADTTITVSATPASNFGRNMLGGNLTPWGGYWPDSQYNSMLKDMGMNLFRVGHGEKWYVDMEAWYPTKGGTPNWKAGGSEGTGKTFDDQIAWWKSLGMPIEYTLNDELSTAMLNADGTLNVNEVARAWSLHIKHIIDSGVDLRYVEIGNEVDIAPSEGIEYPPVEQSRGGQSGTGRFIDPKVTTISSNDYIRLWNAVYPAIKAVAPNVKISAYPSGQGPATAPYFPYDYLFTQSPYRPDFFPIHSYSFGTSYTAPQKVLDSTWMYTGKFYVDWEGTTDSVQNTLAGFGAAGTEIGITEFNYDGAGQYTNANQMWDALYYASVIANAANSGIQHTTIWETFAGSNTDELISDIYVNPTPQMRSQALAMRLMKQFATPDRVVLSSTVQSSDNGVAYDWDGGTLPAGVAGPRVESLATRDASGTKTLLINKNVSTAHNVALNLQGVTASQATVELYSTRASLASQTPTRTTVAVSGGSLAVALPPMSMAVVTVASGGVTPPADTTPPSVTLTSPTSGSIVTGQVDLSAMASDAGSGVSRVDFLVDGQLVGTDSSSPYSLTWDSSTVAAGSHTMQARAVDGAGNVSTAMVSFTVAAPADTTAPSVTLTAPAAGTVITGATTLSATASDAGSGVARVEFLVDGQVVGTDSSSPYSVAWDSTTVAVGNHTVQARAVDGAGNAGTSSVTITVAAPAPADTTAPSVKITAPAAGSPTVGSVTISANASDAGSGVARVEFRVDGKLVGTDASAPYSTVWSAPTGSGPITQGPIVSFTFDDTNLAEYTDYFPVLKAAGYPGTAYVNTDDVVNQLSWKMSLAQLTEMRDAGWEISSHTSDHWNNLPSNPTTSDYEGPVATAKAWLDSNGFPNSGFASPNGNDNAIIRAVVAKYHPYNRTSWGPGTLPVSDPYGLNCSPIDYQSLTSLEGVLDTIQSDNGWAIFLSHAYEPPTVFQQLVNEVKARGIPVRTVRDVVVGSAQAGPHTIQVTAIDNAGNSASDSIVVNDGSTTPPPPADTTPPAPVSSFTALPTNSVSLSWTLPSDPDLAAVRVLRSTAGYAGSATDTAGQQVVYEGLANGFVDHPSTSAITYYTAFTRDTAGNWSSAATTLQDPVTAIVAPRTIAVPLRAAASIRVRLVDDKGNGINGRVVKLRRSDGFSVTMTNVTGSGTPDGTYYATMKRLRQKSTPVTVTFAGDSFFTPSTATIYLVQK